ncbi:MAG: molybdate ABC transporter permease subunit [Pseudomonadota bacterium]
MSDDWAAVETTALLAITTVLILMLIATPLAWFLATSRSRFARLLETVVTLPLVLPPTVLGFYLLVLLGPAGIVGSWWVALTGETLTFSFTGLVIASCVHSLPFAVQPVKDAFSFVGTERMEAAATLGAAPLDAFATVALPLAVRGYITAAVLTFAHTLGEFGVLLMVGGNIPGKTQVLSVAIYNHVESFNYAAAERLSIGLVLIAFLILLFVNFFNARARPQIVS